MSIEDKNLAVKMQLMKSRLSFKKATVEETVESLKRVFKEGLDEDYYYRHELLLGKEKDFVEEVISLDQGTDFISISQIASYGTTAQRELGILLNEMGSLLAKISSVGITNDIEKIVNRLKKLDGVKNEKKEVFGLLWNKKVPKNVGDYIREYELTESFVNQVSSEIGTKMVVASPFFEKLENLMENYQVLTLHVEEHIVAGRIKLSRPFHSTDVQKMMTVSQFEKRVNDLETFFQFVQISLQQTAIAYRNAVTQIIDAVDVLNTTLPVWKNMYSQLMNNWKMTGVVDNSDLNQLLQDATFAATDSKTTELINNLKAEQDER